MSRPAVGAGVAQVAQVKGSGVAASAPLAQRALLLYTGSRAEVSRTAASLYTGDAVFISPLLRVQGRDSIVAHLLAWRLFVWATTAEEVAVLVAEPTRLELRFVLCYQMSPLGGTLRVMQTTTFMLDRAGVVQAHTDDWHGALGLLGVLPWPICHVYDAWRAIWGRAASAVALGLLGLVDGIRAVALSLLGLLSSVFEHLISEYVAGAKLSVLGVLATLLDVRGMCLAAMPVSPDQFAGATAVIVGDLTPVLRLAASKLLAGGATSVHLVGSAGPPPTPQGGRQPGLPPPQPLPGLRPGGGQEVASSGGTAVTMHGVDFLRPGEVTRWCQRFCQLLGQRPCVSVLVLSSVAAAPKEHRFTSEALDQAFAADVVALQALLAGLRPVLSPGARVVITTSASCCWLSDSSCKALSAEGPHSDALAVGAVQARAHQQAARVALAAHQARKWAGEEAGPICLSCTPAAFWSAWTDLLAWAGLLDTARAARRGVLLRRAAEQVQSAVTASIADAILSLCRPDVHVLSGEYYWGRCRSAGPFAGTCGGSGVADADIGRMLVILALRSGQLPG